MILYKYVAFDTAIEIIKHSTLGFTCLENFNDPFECTNFGFTECSIPISTKITALKNNFSRKYATLSLTRNPLNSLMWAHYGDSHRGVVIGIDVKEAGFNSKNEFVIPVQSGEITYINTKPKGDMGEITTDYLDSIGSSTLSYSSEYDGFLRRAFLYKSTEWSYEEEVRVIKNITNLPKHSYYFFKDFEYIGDFGDKWHVKRLKYLNQPLYCYEIPMSAIKEIYLGNKYIHNGSRLNNGKSEAFYSEIIDGWKKVGIRLFTCGIDYYSWNLVANPLK